MEDDHYSTNSILVEVGENYLSTSARYGGDYEIVSNSGHLETIESLVESEDVDWRYYDD